jgi:hypothetical protein
LYCSGGRGASVILDDDLQENKVVNENIRMATKPSGYFFIIIVEFERKVI